MAFDISTFRSSLSDTGILKTNHFDMLISPPIALNSFSGGSLTTGQSQNFSGLDIATQLSFQCEATVLPGVNLMMTEHRRYGYGVSEKKPYTAQFNDLPIAVRADALGNNWRFFMSWFKLVFNFDMRRGISEQNGFQFAGLSDAEYAAAFPYEVNYKTTYMTDVQLRIYDPTGNPSGGTAGGTTNGQQDTPVLTITLRECYPVLVSDIPLNWGETDANMKFPVVLTYIDWYEDTSLTNQTINGG